MVPSPEPAKDESSKLLLPRELFHITPLSFTPKWKLKLTNATGDILYHVTHRPTTPPQYQIQSVADDDSVLPLLIRTKAINGFLRFTLYTGEQQRYILRPAAITPHLLLQNARRQILARFIPITPEITLLRTPLGTRARIRAKAHPSPLEIIFECKITQPQEWLLPVLLYAIARIEEITSTALPETESAPEPPELDTP